MNILPLNLRLNFFLKCGINKWQYNYREIEERWHSNNVTIMAMNKFITEFQVLRSLATVINVILYIKKNDSMTQGLLIIVFKKKKTGQDFRN